MGSKILLLILLLPAVALAEGQAVPAASVEDNIRAMDKDRDGMVTVAEIRAFLEAKNGKGYKHDLLDEMEAKAGAKSCASPFSQSFY
jgi:Ca2+-binding EF-hand superfamily protein